MIEKLLGWFKKTTSFKTELLKTHPSDYSWRVVSFSFDVTGYDLRHTKIQLQNEKLQWLLQFPQQKKSSFPLIIDSADKKQSWKSSMVTAEEESVLNLFLHETMRVSMEEMLDFMRAPVSGVTSADYQNEAQFLKWFEVSLNVLHKALDKFHKDPALVLTGCFFAGKRAENGERLVRLIIFNLDIFFYLQEDNSLRVLIFDDKDKGHGSGKTPVFQQIIKVTKPQFYDQMVNILQRVTQHGEFH
jgi:hypothetical protein